MNAAGIIVEYNPLHNGHLYHIQETKKLTHCEVLIAVMSGNFLQRGEPAFLPKYVRTNMALQAGVDLVIELPYAYATQKAETFASGAVSILHALAAQTICFGSESGSIEDFLHIIHQKETQHDFLQEKVKKQMKQGMSYPKALSEALQQIHSSSFDVTLPNNILGMHYVEAIHRHKSNIIPKTITRFGSNYHDTMFQHTIASATSIRKTLLDQKMDMRAVETVIPSFTKELTEAYINEYATVHFWQLYFPYLQYTILTKTKEELQQIYEMEEGLENRLLTFIEKSHSFEEFMRSIKTKRYTWTRLQRLCTHILTNTTKAQMKEATETVPYVKILGMTKRGQSYLSMKKKSIDVPLVANNKAYNHPLLTLDQKATAAYYSVLPSPLRLQAIRAEWNHPPIII